MGQTSTAHATTITFDGAITQPAGAPPPQDEMVGIEYNNLPFNNPPILQAFFTQGFAFGGATTGPLPGVIEVELSVIDEPNLCPMFGVVCPDNGTQWLAGEDPFSLVVAGAGGLFSISSFQASEILCPECNEDAAVDVLRVYGFRSGQQVAFNSFSVDFGFQLFTLTDPDGDWSNVVRVVFVALNSAGEQTIVAIDNIDATAVPEPASLTLLATGLLGAGLRRARRRG